MMIERKLLPLLLLSACSSQSGLFKSQGPGEGVRIIKNSQTHKLRGIRLQEMESRYALERDKTQVLVDFLSEAGKSGALFVSHIRVTDYSPTESCVLFVGPEEELKTELLTQLNASTGAIAASKNKARQVRTDYLSEHYSKWRLAETKALCQPADGSRTSGFTLVQARVYLSAEKLNQALD